MPAARRHARLPRLPHRPPDRRRRHGDAPRGTSPEEALGAAPVVVNCTGLGARDLVGDPQLRPVRGQLLVVENPGIDTVVRRRRRGPSPRTYFFPQPYGLLLGGTADDGAWDLTPDPATADAIRRRCAAVDPRVATARVLAHRTGLRPARPEVRLHRDGPVVHHYGHGGAGVTVSGAPPARRQPWPGRDATTAGGPARPGQPSIQLWVWTRSITRRRTWRICAEVRGGADSGGPR